METDYLEQVADEKEELEPKADNCPAIIVARPHTFTISMFFTVPWRTS